LAGDRSIDATYFIVTVIFRARIVIIAVSVGKGKSFLRIARTNVTFVITGWDRVMNTSKVIIAPIKSTGVMIVTINKIRPTSNFSIATSI
jgi:hypothetical protein